MLRSKWLYAVTLFPSLVLAADQTLSEGVNAVVCYDNNNEIQTVELFDYWEQKQLSNLKLDVNLGGDELSVREKVQKVLKRIQHLSPNHYDAFVKNSNKIIQEIESYDDSPGFVSPNEDTSIIFPKSPCRKESIIVRNKDKKKGNLSFIVNSELYHHRKTSNDTRAGVILHETFYKTATEEGKSSFDDVRYYNYLVSTTLFENSPLEYFNIDVPEFSSKAFVARVGLSDGHSLRSSQTNEAWVSEFSTSKKCRILLENISIQNEFLDLNLTAGDCINGSSNNVRHSSLILDEVAINSTGTTLQNTIKTTFGLLDLKSISNLQHRIYTSISTTTPLTLHGPSYEFHLDVDSMEHNLTLQKNSDGILDWSTFRIKNGEIKHDASNLKLKVTPSSNIKMWSKDIFRVPVKAEIISSNGKQEVFKGYASIQKDGKLKSITLGYENVLVIRDGQLYKRKFTHYEKPKKKVGFKSFALHNSAKNAKAFCQEKGHEDRDGYIAYKSSPHLFSYTYGDKMQVKLSGTVMSRVSCIDHEKLDL